MKKLILSLSVLFLGLCSMAQLDRSVAPEPQPNPPIELNIPDAIEFDNGLQVIVVENHKLPQVSFQLFCDYPISPEGDKSGLSGLFGEMMGAGTTNTPKDAFDSKVDYIGATLATTSRGFYASSLKKHTPILLGLLSEVVTSPAFPEDEFERIKKQTLSGLASSKNDASSISANISNIINYGSDHPYGEVTTEETIENITLDDVKNFYKEKFVPNHSYLIIVGDVTVEEAKGYVNEYFSGWKSGVSSTKMTYNTPTASGSNVYFGARPGAVQSVINITHKVDLKPGHEDIITVRIMNQILGGGSFSARLMSNLREDKAYTYGCYSSMSSDPLMGEFSAGGSFRNEVTDSAVTQILMEISRMVNEQVTDEELSLVKNSMTGSFARSLESPQTIASFALNTVRYNLPRDYYSTYLQRLEKITKEDIQNAAKKYLSPENLNIVIVGNSEIAEKLVQFDSDGSISYKDHYGQEAVSLKQAPEGITVESIIQTYVYKYMMVSSEEELEAKLAKIGMIEVTATAFVEEMGANMTLMTYSGAMNKTASVMSVNTPTGVMAVQREHFNGESGGTFMMGAGKTKYEGDDLEAKKRPNFPVSQRYYLSNPNLEVKLLGIDEMNDKEYYKLQLKEKDSDELSFEYYSVETGLLCYSESIVQDEEGNSFTTLIEFSEYTEIKKGLYMPHKMTINAGEQVLEFNTIKVKVKKKPVAPQFDGDF